MRSGAEAELEIGAQGKAVFAIAGCGGVEFGGDVGEYEGEDEGA